MTKWNILESRSTLGCVSDVEAGSELVVCYKEAFSMTKTIMYGPVGEAAHHTDAFLNYADKKYEQRDHYRIPVI